MAVSVALKQTIRILLLSVVALILGVFYWPSAMPDTAQRADLCMNCHQDVADMDASHPVETFGCAQCHLGNPNTADKQSAHAGMVRNPSDLHWASHTCGQVQCHPDLVESVQKSIMTTNSGLVASTLLQWHESALWDDSLQHIDGGFPDSSLATSHIRKLCAGCHVNKREHDFPGEFGRRGGGCNDCHLLPAKQKGGHPRFTVEIGISVCEKCHNRSNRTALNYQGKFESEGYGTPFEGGNTGSDTLSGGRYFYHIPADVHFKAGLVCIDCHSAEDVMGDGRLHAHLETQVHIRCSDCHQARFARPDSLSRVFKLVQVNKHLRLPSDSLFAQTRAGTFLPNVVKAGKGVGLIRKTDGKILSVPQTQNKAECNLPGHERLACQACHTAYIPQCYGCHDTYDPNRMQMDKVSGRETPGHWSEGRSYLRFEDPPLMLDQLNRVMPSAPGCQVLLTDLRDSSQTYWPTMAAFDPHSTRTKVPECVACHSDPKRLGLGPGALGWTKGVLSAEPVYNAAASGLGNHPPEQITDGKGNAVQRMSRRGERPFNQNELNRIVGLSLCLTCHDSYRDAVYRDFDRSLTRYQKDATLPCRNKQ